jgi:hypothetical protein
MADSFFLPWNMIRANSPCPHRLREALRAWRQFAVENSAFVPPGFPLFCHHEEKRSCPAGRLPVSGSRMFAANRGGTRRRGFTHSSDFPHSSSVDGGTRRRDFAHSSSADAGTRCRGFTHSPRSVHGGRKTPGCRGRASRPRARTGRRYRTAISGASGGPHSSAFSVTNFLAPTISQAPPAVI